MREKHKIILVTGGTRGVGRGVVLALAQAGMTVYFTGRTRTEGAGAVKLSGSIETTEAEARKFNPAVFGIYCDHTDDQQTEKVVEKIIAVEGKIDILVNCVWGGYEHYSNGTEFWKEREFWTIPLSRWHSMFDAGVRAQYTIGCSVAARMIQEQNGLLINLSFWAAERNDMGVLYSAAKAAANKITATMAYEMAPYQVYAVTLYPGLVRTESVLAAGEYYDLSNSESPEFIGRVIEGLTNDAGIEQKSGKILIVAELAKEYGIMDIDGKQPVPLTLDTCK